MLRLSSDRILIALAPDSLAFLRVSGRARHRVREKRTIACDPAFGAQPWQGAVAALEQLAEETRDANADVTVVLYNKHQVVANFAFAKEKLTDKDVNEIVAAIEKMAPKK